MSSLAEAYTKQRKYAKAAPLALKAVEDSKANCKAVPIACALIRSNLGDYYMAQGQWETAELEFEQALKLRQDTFGEHPLVADSLISMSRALHKLKGKKEAKTYEAQAREMLSGQTNREYDHTVDVRSFKANDR
jgi:tetratricopeptide (TPR) repeat protein